MEYSFSIVTDTSSNLPKAVLDKYNIDVIPFTFFIDCDERTCTDIDSFDMKTFYDNMRNGTRVSTSQINPNTYEHFFRERLEKGQDILFISMSSGISGSYNCSEIAANTLKAHFPDRKIRLIDTLGASLGEGLFAIEAAKMRDAGADIDEIYNKFKDSRYEMCQVFTVGDLTYLKNTGRLSNIAALVGMVLHIKPVLKGNNFGKIVSFAKLRGRKKAIEALAEYYDKYVRDSGSQTIGIAHADCENDAQYLISLLKKNNPPLDIMTVCYEPVTGSHVGPGTLALFFMGNRKFRD